MLRVEPRTAAAVGPAPRAAWRRRTTPAGALLLTPDAADAGTTWFLPGEHRVLRGEDGFPALALTLVLAGLPGPAETDVTARVRQATLALTLDLAAAPPWTEPDGHFVPVYPRGITVELVDADGAALASGVGVGDRARVPISVTLDEPGALAVLSALDGTGDRLTLRSTLRYRTAPGGISAHLTGSWAQVHDLLIPGVAVDLRDVFARALRVGALVADPPGDADMLFASFAAMAKPVLFDATGAPGVRPSPLFTVDLAHSGRGPAGEESVVVSDPLRRILGGLLSGSDRGRAISILAVHADGAPAPGTAVPAAVGAPRRVRSTPVRRGPNERSPALALLPSGRLESTTGMLAAPRDGRSSVFAYLTASNARPIAAGVLAASLDDHKEGAGAPTSLPVVHDEAGWFFADRVDSGLSWYVPSFEVVRPAPTDDASHSPFVFSFRRSGATAAAEPGLDATVTFRLRQVIGPEAAAAAGAGAPRAVPTDGLEFVLDLPFRDADGQNRRQRFPAVTSREGDVVTATVSLLDDWARLAYGALSQPGFQAEPARVGVAWSFQGWVSVELKIDTLVYGGKNALLPIRYVPAQVEDLHVVDPLSDPDPLATTDRRAYFDATSATYRSAVGALQFTVQRSAPDRARASALRPMVAVHAELERPALLDIAANENLRPFKVPIQNGAGFRERPERWMQQTFLRSQSLDVVYPCAQLGSCYVEERPEGPVAVGCQDALRLGQTAWRQYEEVVELADPEYRVFRSLQQPGRFLLLPARYVTTRHPATTPVRAYHPMMLLYALLDATDPTSSQVVIQATLGPAVPAAAEATLLRRLAAYAPNPTLTLAGDVECRPTFEWTIVGLPTVDIRATMAPGGIAVALTSDLAHALLLRDLLTHSGIQGGLVLELPDGSTMRSALSLGLATMTGPADGGPVEVTDDGVVATLVNRIERAVSVLDLRVDTGGPALVDLPVERLLAPGESVQVDLAAAVPAGPGRCLPVYVVPPAAPAALEEIRSFVEDIAMNVVFMDLTDHPTHHLARLEVRAQLAGASGIQDVPMSGTPASGTATFVLPLTDYLTRRIVRYQISIARTDGTTADGPWLEWDIAAAGCLVSLTWNGSGLPDTAEENP